MYMYTCVYIMPRSPQRFEPFSVNHHMGHNLPAKLPRSGSPRHSAEWREYEQTVESQVGKRVLDHSEENEG